MMINTKVMLDSVAASNFIDEDLAKLFEIPQIPYKSPLIG